MKKKGYGLGLVFIGFRVLEAWELGGGGVGAITMVAVI